jgi:hypothetical protein
VSKLQPVSKLSRCIRCGAKNVKPRPGKGRTTRFRHIPAMAIPDSLLVQTCGRCQSQYIDESESLAKELRAAYLSTLRLRARDALGRLMEHTSQRWLEWHLGLSQGYLCRIQAGAGNPSAELVSLLALLCQDPVTRLAELERFWLLPDDNWLPPPIPPTRRRRRNAVAVESAPPPAPAALETPPFAAAQVREKEEPSVTAVELGSPVESTAASAPLKPTVRRGQAGGLAAQASGKAHKFTPEEARAAGKRGGPSSLVTESRRAVNRTMRPRL